MIFLEKPSRVMLRFKDGDWLSIPRIVQYFYDEIYEQCYLVDMYGDKFEFETVISAEVESDWFWKGDKDESADY